MSKKDFYIAVDDVTYFIGKMNKMRRLYWNYDPDLEMFTVPEEVSEEYKKRYKQPEYDYRCFSKKFVSDPYIAIINSVYQDHKESNSIENRKKLFSKITFNTNTDCYEFDEYYTLGYLHFGSTLPPKPIHWEKYAKGEYELIQKHHEIQIFKTEPAKIDLDEMKNFLNNIKKFEETHKCKCPIEKCDCSKCSDHESNKKNCSCKSCNSYEKK